MAEAWVEGKRRVAGSGAEVVVVQRTRPGLWLAGWAAAVVGLAAFGAVAADFAGRLPDNRPLGQPAPLFTLDRFPGTSQVVPGRAVPLERLRGRLVVVNFWSSWCDDCRGEAEFLERVWQDYRDRGVVFIGVAIHDVEQPARAYIRRSTLTYPSGPDADGAIAGAYGVFDVPETYFVSADGRIVRRHAGPLTEAALRGYLDDLLR